MVIAHGRIRAERDTFRVHGPTMGGLKPKLLFVSLMAIEVMHAMHIRSHDEESQPESIAWGIRKFE